MADDKPSVDAVWAALKQSTAAAGKRRAAGAGLGGLGGIPGVTSTVRTFDKSRGPPPPASARPSFIGQLGQGARGEGGSAQAPADCQALLATLQRDINGLSDPDRSTRRRSIEKLHAALLGSPGGVAPGALQAALAGPLLVPLVRLLADPAEKCRELAVAFFSEALPRLPAPGGAAPLLPTLAPALAERVGTPPVQEGSEELRLALAELVAGPLLGAAPRPLPPDLLPPLVATLCCQLQDAYADIKRAACTSIAALAALLAPAALPSQLLQPLVASLVSNLTHQHSRVRLAALQALHSLVLGGMPQAVMQERVLPAVRPLAHDHAPAVRAVLFASVAQWAGSQLPSGADGSDDDGRAANQARAFLPLLLPLLLLGLTDEVEAIRSDAYAQLDAIAARLTSGSSGSGDAMAVDGPSSQAQQQAAALPGYCHPFSVGRPSLAARALVQAQLMRLLQQSLAELREWRATLRLSAARLLRASLIYGEEEAAPLLPTVVQALRNAVADDDASVAAQATGCVHVLGVNLPARHWLPLAAELVTAEAQSVAQRTAALLVLSALLYAAGRAGTPVDAGSLQLAADTLASPLVAGGAAAADGGPQRQQLLAACANLVHWEGDSVARVAPQLFQLLLPLWALEAAAAQDAAAEKAADADALTAAAVLEQLAAAVGSASAAGLCERYGPALLQRCLQSHAQWAHAHTDWRVLSALLRLSSAAALEQLVPAAAPALASIAADHERDPRLRLELLQLTAALAEDDSKAAAWPQPTVGLALVRGVLQPALVWRAGRGPAACRYAALSATAALLGKGRLPAEQLQQLAAASSSEGGGGSGLLSLVAGCLDDDYELDTRQLACSAVQLLLDAVGPALAPAQLAALQPELLRRLDDSTNRVRVAACAALSSWLRAAVAHGGGSGGGGRAGADAAALAAALLIHVGDPDEQVAAAAGAALEQLTAAAPVVVQPLMAGAQQP